MVATDTEKFAQKNTQVRKPVVELMSLSQAPEEGEFGRAFTYKARQDIFWSMRSGKYLLSFAKACQAVHQDEKGKKNKDGIKIMDKMGVGQGIFEKLNSAIENLNKSFKYDLPLADYDDVNTSDYHWQGSLPPLVQNPKEPGR